MYATDWTPPCRRTDPELWFSKIKREQQLAMTLCMSCRDRALCLEQTLQTERDLGHTLQGIFAATTKADRENLLQRSA